MRDRPDTYNLNEVINVTNVCIALLLLGSLTFAGHIALSILGESFRALHHLNIYELGASLSLLIWMLKCRSVLKQNSKPSPPPSSNSSQMNASQTNVYLSEDSINIHKKNTAQNTHRNMINIGGLMIYQNHFILFNGILQILCGLFLFISPFMLTEGLLSSPSSTQDELITSGDGDLEPTSFAQATIISLKTINLLEGLLAFATALYSSCGGLYLILVTSVYFEDSLVCITSYSLFVHSAYSYSDGIIFVVAATTPSHVAVFIGFGVVITACGIFVMIVWCGARRRAQEIMAQQQQV
eukprot:GHVN01023870.1.p1 GENE.GHVN01023870.1~~GHVN01023870.1.p1  ORF type:complete len:297 (-),score=38.52 GHVN01023870.1:231-1121(-)